MTKRMITFFPFILILKNVIIAFYARFLSMQLDLSFLNGFCSCVTFSVFSLALLIVFSFLIPFFSIQKKTKKWIHFFIQFLGLILVYYIFYFILYPIFFSTVVSVFGLGLGLSMVEMSGASGASSSEGRVNQAPQSVSDPAGLPLRPIRG